MDLSKLRQLSEEGRNNREEQEAEEARQSLRRKEESANRAIAELAQLVTECARRGENSTRAFHIHLNEMLSTPREKVFVMKKEYSPNCLPSYARKVYDYCEGEGFKTRLFDPYDNLFDFYIEIRW